MKTKNTHKSIKQIFIKNGQRQMLLEVKPGLRPLNLTFIPSAPYWTNSVN